MLLIMFQLTTFLNKVASNGKLVQSCTGAGSISLREKCPLTDNSEKRIGVKEMKCSCIGRDPLNL